MIKRIINKIWDRVFGKAKIDDKNAETIKAIILEGVEEAGIFKITKECVEDKFKPNELNDFCIEHNLVLEYSRIGHIHYIKHPETANYNL